MNSEVLSERPTRGRTPQLQATSKQSTYSSPANHVAKSSACSFQAALSCAAVVQLLHKCSAINRRMPSSHFIQRMREGLIGISPPCSIARLVQSESRHDKTCQSQVEGGRLAACPAHNHFLYACACSQSRTSVSTASLRGTLNPIQPKFPSSSSRPTDCPHHSILSCAEFSYFSNPWCPCMCTIHDTTAHGGTSIEEPQLFFC